MKKNLTKIWLLLPLLMMGNLFAACSGSDGGESNPPTEHKMTATIKTAAPYTELGFKDDVAPHVQHLQRLLPARHPARL